SNRANLEAPCELDRRRRSQRDLDAAAADVDDDRAAAGDVDAVDGRLMNQARFFDARDDARPDAGVTLDAGEKLAAVARFARGARSYARSIVMVRTPLLCVLRQLNTSSASAYWRSAGHCPPQRQAMLSRCIRRASPRAGCARRFRSWAPAERPRSSRSRFVV